MILITGPKDGDGKFTNGTATSSDKQLLLICMQWIRLIENMHTKWIGYGYYLDELKRGSLDKQA